MKVTCKKEALDLLDVISIRNQEMRECQKRAKESFSPLTKAAEAEKGINLAIESDANYIEIIKYLITSGDAKECESCQIQASEQ